MSARYSAGRLAIPGPSAGGGPFLINRSKIIVQKREDIAMTCDFCGHEFKLVAGGYRLLPIIDLKEFPPRGVYACAACVAAVGVDALVARHWAEEAAEKEAVVSHRRQSLTQMRLEVAA